MTTTNKPSQGLLDGPLRTIFVNEFHKNARAVQSPIHGHRQMVFRSFSTHKTFHFASHKMSKKNQCLFPTILLTYSQSGFGGLGVACWSLVPKFAGSNPAGAVGFLGAKKSSAHLPSEGK